MSWKKNGLNPCSGATKIYCHLKDHECIQIPILCSKPKCRLQKKIGLLQPIFVIFLKRTRLLVVSIHNWAACCLKDKGFYMPNDVWVLDQLWLHRVKNEEYSLNVWWDIYNASTNPIVHILEVAIFVLKPGEVILIVLQDHWVFQRTPKFQST